MNDYLQCRIAQTEEERDQVYRLRYECYRRDASIEVNDTQSFRDHIDSDPNHFSFLVSDDSKPAIATMRVTVVRPDRGWNDSPGMHVFGDHPALNKIASESFVEASRLCFAEQARRDAFFRLLANMSAMADFYEVDWLVACPRIEHADVYRNLFGFETLAEPRQYYDVKFKTGLLAIRRATLHAHVAKRRVMKQACEHALQSLTCSNDQALYSPFPQLFAIPNARQAFAA